MFSSRNIHFTILGIILGAVSGYIFAFYQVQTTMARPPEPAATSGAPPDHPNVTPEQILAMFNKAIERNPNDPELMSRYADFRSSLGRNPEALEWLQKVFTVQVDGQHDPKSATVTVKRMEEIDPKYPQLPALKKRLAESAKTVN